MVGPTAATEFGGGGDDGRAVAPAPRIQRTTEVRTAAAARGDGVGGAKKPGGVGGGGGGVIGGNGGLFGPSAHVNLGFQGQGTYWPAVCVQARRRANKIFHGGIIESAPIERVRIAMPPKKGHAASVTLLGAGVWVFVGVGGVWPLRLVVPPGAARQNLYCGDLLQQCLERQASW